LKDWNEVNDSASRRLAKKGYEFLGVAFHYGPKNDMSDQLLLRKEGTNYVVSVGYTFSGYRVKRTCVSTVHGTTKDKIPLFGISIPELSAIDEKLASEIRRNVGEAYKEIIVDEGIDFL